MATITQQNPSLNAQASQTNWQAWLLVAALIYLLLASVGAIGSGFKIATGSNAKELFSFASNPVIALIIGVVATALIQSSSTVTSIIVGMVAGGLPLSIAIPMVMGANIGTSLTSTLVSLGHVRNGEEFRRAFAAATVHDSFNILAVTILLPLELLFKPLQRTAEYMSGFIVSDASVSMSDMNFMKVILAPADDALKFITGWLPEVWSGVALIVIGIALILFVVSAIGKLLRKVMVGKAKDIVPLAGTGVFSIRQIYPFTLGANVGTTITALLAATAISGPTAELALQIALVHLLFNILAILLIYVLPVFRLLPIKMAETLAFYAQKNKLYVVAYIGGVFFVIPLLIIGISQIF
jgi:sodium-dependent phosphate cotransporter